MHTYAYLLDMSHMFEYKQK